MAADFKSHVLLRDEKGVFGIPFKRLLLAGVGGGLTYTVFNLSLPGWSILIALIAVISIVLLTAPRGGIPLWNRLLYRLRGILLLLAVRFPQSSLGRLTQTLELPIDLMRLDGAEVFAPPSGEVEVNLSEWITYAYPTETDGLVFVDAPLKEVTHE